MDEIKIGDIVAPTTPKRRKLFGKGMVIAVKRSSRLPVTVIFPAKDAYFTTHEFREHQVGVVKCTNEKYKEIVGVAYNHRQLLEDLKRA